MPAFPDVASITDLSRVSSPAKTASPSIRSTGLSLIDPPGFRCSHFTLMRAAPTSDGISNRTIGVFPIAVSGGYFAMNSKYSFDWGKLSSLASG